jgi:hypothetical protein
MFKWQLIALTAPVLARTYLEEAFFPESNKWYNSKLTKIFNIDAGNSKNWIDDYGLYAKYGDHT